MSMNKGELLDFANGIKELIVENGRLKHINERYAENIKLLEEKSIPIEWLIEEIKGSPIGEIIVEGLTRRWRKEHGETD